jgi:hypothetical protein
MVARLLILFCAIVSYAVFLVSFLYAVGFVGKYLVPKSIDVGGREFERGHRRRPAAARHTTKLSDRFAIRVASCRNAHGTPC